MIRIDLSPFTRKSRPPKTREVYLAPTAQAFCFLTTETGDLLDLLPCSPGLELACVHKAFFQVLDIVVTLLLKDPGPPTGALRSRGSRSRWLLHVIAPK
jgi:hypothetical protein